MTDKIKRYGEGLTSRIHTVSLYDGTYVEIETLELDLSTNVVASKVSIDNIDSYNATQGQVLMMGDCGALEWSNPYEAPDKELREQYPGLQISWDRVMEALHEYEMVKKLVQDYD